MKVTITFDKLNVKNRFKKINVDNKIEKILVKMIAATGPQGPTGPQGEQGPQGPAGAVKIIAVTELPATGETGTIYLVPNEDTETENNYIEYIYINGAWEKFGETQVGVDLTDYVKNTDYATSTTGGVVKISYESGINRGASGHLTARTLTNKQYESSGNGLFVGKGTLENVITGKALETANNKVTELTSSSTDTQYPSAKATYDELKKQKDTLENLMPKKEVEGETISVTDAADYPLLKFEVNGNTSQDGEPTPDTPVEVKVVKGENVVSVSGINLWDEQWELGRLEALTSSANFGQNVNTTDQIRSKNYIKIKADTYYYGKLGSNVGSVFAICYDENYNAIPSWSYKNLTNRICSLATPSNAKYMRFYVNAEYGKTYKNDICINQSDTNINGKYYPYSKTDYPINLGDIELCKINTYKDYFHKNNGKWYLEKQIGKVVLDGSERWELDTIKDITRIFQLPLNTTLINKKNNNNDFFSDHFINQTGDTEKIGWSTNYLYIAMKKTTTNTLVEFKTWLSTHNTIVYYVLATPTEEEITNTTLIEQLNALNNATLNKGNNTITSLYPDGNEQAILRVKYIRSLDIILASLENV